MEDKHELQPDEPELFHESQTPLPESEPAGASSVETPNFVDSFFTGAGDLTDAPEIPDQMPAMESFFAPPSTDTLETDIPDASPESHIPEVHPEEAPSEPEVAMPEDIPPAQAEDDDLFHSLLGPTQEAFPQEPAEPESNPTEPSSPVSPSMGDTQKFDPAQPKIPADDLNLDSILADFTDESHQIPDTYDTFEPDPYTELAVDAPFLGSEEERQEFEEMFAANSGEEEPPPTKKHTPRPVRKGRPKRKKGDGLLGIPHVLATLIWLAIIVVIGVSLGKLLWVGAADVLAFGRDSRAVTVTIVENDTLDTIVAKLQNAGLVKYPELFKVYAKLTGAEEEIITGTFELNTSLDYHALVNSLSPSSSNRTEVEVLIPEGYSSKQIYELLAENNVCSVAALEEYAASGQFSDFWFLENVERGDKYCLEGFLFPDTYKFYVNSTPREALGKMLTGFNSRFSSDMKEQIAVLNEQLTSMMRSKGCSEEYITEHQFTVRELVIVASMIEEETASSGESADIASVIYNRLTSKNEYDRYLNIDAAIYYALDGNIDPETGKTKPLTAEDLKIDSPFNTYTHTGLTPTPISNPGLASLEAALFPSETSYYYYVLNPSTGLHQFSKTYEEHQKWVEQFKEAE